MVKFLKTQAEAVDVDAEENDLKIDFNTQANIGGRGFGGEDDAGEELRKLQRWVNMPQARVPVKVNTDQGERELTFVVD